MHLLFRLSAICFKFQSDSINTFIAVVSTSTAVALNSNLILLILMSEKEKEIIETSLNSNLILLIHLATRHQKKTRIHFKFQSDSINTLEASSVNIFLCPLNSNLILLIPDLFLVIIQPEEL